MKIRLVLSDDHQVVRQGLRSLLEQHGFTVTGEASDGREAVRLVEELCPEVAILDLSMPVLNGLDAAREIARAKPGTRTIILTMHTDEHYVLDALHAGVAGYVLKSKAADCLVEAIREVSRGHVYICPSVSRHVVDAAVGKKSAPSELLSQRERQVLQLIAEGSTSKEVASALGVSVKTAESHRSRIMQKLDLHETASLVRYAIRRGLIQPAVLLSLLSTLPVFHWA